MARKKAKALPKLEEIYTIWAEIIQETEDAILINCGESSEVWLPKSQIDYSGERGDMGIEITLPQWLAEQESLEDGQGHPDPVPDLEDVADVDSENTVSAVDEAEEGEGEPGASTVTNDSHFITSECITVRQELTQSEKAEYAEEMSRLDAKIEELEEERDRHMKSLKKQIDAMEEERRSLSKIVREGNEEREIYCDKCADYNACEIVWTDAYPPHAVVQRRPMTAEERQLPLEKKAKPDHAVGEQMEAAGAVEQNTVTLSGTIVSFAEDSIEIDFGEAGTFTLNSDAVSIEGGQEPGEQAAFTIERNVAIEAGIIQPVAEPQPTPEEQLQQVVGEVMPMALEAAAEFHDAAADLADGLGMTLRSCGTCAHINETPQDGEDDPCATCGSNDLPNYAPINGGTSQRAASVQ